LQSQLRNALNVPRLKFVSWKDWEGIKSPDKEKCIILSYRDQGNYQNPFFPNIHEQGNFYERDGNVLLPKLWFRRLVEWKKYHLQKEYVSILDNSIRRSFFNWNELENDVESNRPAIEPEIDWNEESNYANLDDRLKFKIEFISSSRKTAPGRDLFIFQVDKGKIRIDTMENIHDYHYDYESGKLSIQELKEFIEEFNPAEKIIDTQQLKKRLADIKREHGIEEDNENHRLWKILLQKKAIQQGSTELYDELKELFGKKNKRMISRNHFNKTWIDPESDTILPKGKQEFKLICEYLGLGNLYSRSLYMLKNRQAAGRGHATRIYSKFLTDIFNDSLFDSATNLSNTSLGEEDIKRYKSEHDLEELGINEDFFLDEINDLIDLIKPSLNLKNVKKINQLNE
jgi:hypothetical protein